MDNVIVFPTKSVRDRAEIERTIREALLDVGASQESAATVVANMGEFLDLLNLDFKFSFPASISDSVQGQFKEFSVALQERTNRLILERLTMEVNNLAPSEIG